MRRIVTDGVHDPISNKLFRGRAPLAVRKPCLGPGPLTKARWASDHNRAYNTASPQQPHTCGCAPGQTAGRAPFPPTAARAVASLDEAERLNGVVLFLEGLDVVVDSGAGRVGDLEAVDDLPLAAVGGDGEAEVQAGGDAVV